MYMYMPLRVRVKTRLDSISRFISISVIRGVSNDKIGDARMTRTVVVNPGTRTVSQPLHSVRFTFGSLSKWKNVS